MSADTPHVVLSAEEMLVLVRHLPRLMRDASHVGLVERDLLKSAMNKMQANLSPVRREVEA